MFGLLAAIINGAVFPSFSLFFGEVLEVFRMSRAQILDSIHVWAALFLVLGIVSGICNFLKVREGGRGGRERERERGGGRER